MKTKHTPELYARGKRSLEKFIYMDDVHIGNAVTVEFAKRILTCLNACAGMADPAFEIEFLREQLRECTDALRGMVQATTLEFSAANGFYDQRNKAKKVLEDLTQRPQ